MKLYFENSIKVRREIGDPPTQKEAFKIMKDFMDDHHFKSYYTRITVNDLNETYFDVGSWSEFFVLNGNFYQLPEGE